MFQQSWHCRSPSSRTPLAYLQLCLGLLVFCAAASDKTWTGNGGDGGGSGGAGAPASIDSRAAGLALRQCYNEPQVSTASAFASYLAGDPTSSSLRIHRVFWSQREVTLPLTIFTITSLNRLQALAAQCRNLPGGVVSAAVYVPLVEPTLHNNSERLPDGGNRARNVPFHDPRASTPAYHRVEALPDGTQSHRARRLEEQQGQGQEQLQAPQQRRPHQARPHDEGLLSPANRVKLRHAEAKLEGLFRGLEGGERLRAGPGVDAGGPPPACSLRLMLLYELVADDVMAALMPINALRNAAMLGATTPLAAMVDVDLSPSWGLAHRVLVDKRRIVDMQRRGEQERVVWVLPAWDTHKRLNMSERKGVADTVAALRPHAKPVLARLWLSENMIYPFASDVYRAGHHATNFSRWLKTDAEYGISYQPGFEPWVIAARSVLPIYDARFRGYSWNKVVHLQYLAASGFRFQVLPDAWLVHRPHEPTASCSVCPKVVLERVQGAAALSQMLEVRGVRVTARRAFRNQTKTLYMEAVQRMQERAYEPPGDAASRHCRAVLPWWR